MYREGAGELGGVWRECARRGEAVKVGRGPGWAGAYAVVFTIGDGGGGGEGRDGVRGDG